MGEKRNEEWLQWIAPERFNDIDLQRIVTFFVFHSPCKELSAMSKTLDEYGWKKPWQKPYWLNKQLIQASTNCNLLFPANTYQDFDIALKKAGMYDKFPDNLEQERIALYDKKKNQFMSVFYHLRNAFAHCRLNMVDVNNECVFVLEDAYKQKITARMILKKSTLIKWIDIIEAGEKVYQKNQKNDI